MTLKEVSSILFGPVLIAAGALSICGVIISLAACELSTGDEVLPTEPPPPVQVVVGGTCTVEPTEGGSTARIACRDESRPPDAVESVRWRLFHGDILLDTKISGAESQVFFEAAIDMAHVVEQTVFTDDGRQLPPQTYPLET